MTFAETDYAGLISEIERIVEGKNPFETIAMIKELLNIHRNISLYPGLVALVGKSSKQEATHEDLRIGDFITWSKDGRSFAGAITKKDDSGIYLETVCESFEQKDFKLTEGKVTKISHDALQRTWPSLVFPEKVKMSKTVSEKVKPSFVKRQRSGR